MMAALRSIHYCVKINGLTVQVTKHEGEPDYSAEVEATFARFKQGAAKSYTFDFLNSPDMNHVEAQVLEQLAHLYAEEFSRLETFAETNGDFLDRDVVTFDREIQFYVAYLEHIVPLKNAGLAFCFPRITQDKEVWNHGGFDLALADKLLGEHTKPVCNDFHLRGQERIIVVSGPNQGGKTTFARTFGQLHYLASLGCPVPGQDAQLLLFDKLFTHFEREENAQNLRGKLQDDLERIHDILERATTESIIIMNEIFTSTTLQDAVALSKSIAAKIIQLDLLCVWMTFVDELASFAAQTVSMVSTVDPGNLTERTYKVVRKEADGQSYAMSIAEKYRLTYDMLRDRLTV
jgi:DNA mismatch repair ATPase MutS